MYHALKIDRIFHTLVKTSGQTQNKFLKIIVDEDDKSNFEYPF